MFEERLRKIASRLEGLHLAALVAGDGLAVETLDDDSGLDVEEIAAEVISQLRSIEQQHGETEMGEVRQVTISTSRRTIMVGALASGYYLLLVLGREIPTGRARFELRRAPLAFDADLE